MPDVTLPLPLRGLHRANSFRDQPAETTPDALNVRADGAAERRNRIASRPGTVREPHEVLGLSTITGTISTAVYDAATGLTTITAGAAVFSERVRGSTIFAVMGGDWPIVEYVSTTVIRVTGDASADASLAFSIKIGDPIMMLANVPTVEIVDVGEWSDYFNGNDGDEVGLVWGSDAYFTNGVPIIYKTMAAATDGDFRGAIRSLLDYNVAQPFTIEILPISWAGLQVGTYAVYFGLDDTTPDYNNGFYVTLSWNFHGIGHANNQQVIQLSTGNGTAWTVVKSAYLQKGASPIFGPLTIRVVPATPPSNTTVSISYNGQKVIAYSAAFAWTGKRRFGFSIDHNFPNASNSDPLAHSYAKLDYFKIVYTPTVTTSPPPNLRCAIAGGRFYREGDDGEMAYPNNGSATTFASDRQIDAVSFQGILYMADHGPVVTSGTGGATSGSPTVFDDAGVSDWTALLIDVEDHVLVIETGDAAGAYPINTIHATAGLTLFASLGTLTTLPWHIERGPKKFNPNTDTLSLWYTSQTATDKGFVPVGCPHLAIYMNRLAFAGAPTDSMRVLMSRQNDPLDWEYGSDPNDLGRAVDFARADNEAGQINEPITGLFANSDDYLLVFTENQLRKLEGEPNRTGIFNLIGGVGLAIRRAFCRTPDGGTIFLSRDGLYALGPGGSQYPQAWSRLLLPAEMLISDPTLYFASMAFDVVERGIQLCLTEISGGGGIFYWMDWETKSFWPVQWASATREPTCIIPLPPHGSAGGAALMGTRHGRIVRYSRGTPLDDGASFTTRVSLGPFRLGGDDFNEGSIDDIGAFAAEAMQAGAINWKVRVHASAEGAVNQLVTTADVSGTFNAGFNYFAPVRRSGGAVVVTLQNVAGIPWAIERVVVSAEQMGLQRKA